MNKPTWAVNLKKARKRAGLTQEEMSKRIFKSQQTYCRYEKGEIEPDLATWYIICDILNIPNLNAFLWTVYSEVA